MVTLNHWWLKEGGQNPQKPSIWSPIWSRASWDSPAYGRPVAQLQLTANCSHQRVKSPWHSLISCPTHNVSMCLRLQMPNFTLQYMNMFSQTKQMWCLYYSHSNVPHVSCIVVLSDWRTIVITRSSPDTFVLPFRHKLVSTPHWV